MPIARRRAWIVAGSAFFVGAIASLSWWASVRARANDFVTNMRHAPTIDDFMRDLDRFEDLPQWLIPVDQRREVMAMARTGHKFHSDNEATAGIPDAQLARIGERLGVDAFGR